MAIDADIVRVFPLHNGERVPVVDRKKELLLQKVRDKLVLVDVDMQNVEKKIKFLERFNKSVLDAFVFLLDFDKKLDRETGEYVQNTRRSGEIYAYHALEVLRIIVDEFGFDCKNEKFTDLFVATILHDTYEDELEGKGRYFWKKEDMKLLHMIKSKFKSDGLLLRLDGVSKHKEHGTVNDQETYNSVMRAALVYPDVLKLKLADRLHNWRTIDSMPLTKKLESVRETREFFLPVAEHLGMSKVVDDFNSYIDIVLEELVTYNSQHDNKLVADFENMYDISPWWPRMTEANDSYPAKVNINDLYAIK